MVLIADGVIGLDCSCHDDLLLIAEIVKQLIRRPYFRRGNVFGIFELSTLRGNLEFVCGVSKRDIPQTGVYLLSGTGVQTVVHSL